MKGGKPWKSVNLDGIVLCLTCMTLGGASCSWTRLLTWIGIWSVLLVLLLEEGDMTGVDKISFVVWDERIISMLMLSIKLVLEGNIWGPESDFLNWYVKMFS